MTDIHCGHLIKKELQRQRRSVAWLANEMSCTRGNMYKILERPYLSSDFIIRVSVKLQHDFFYDISLLFRASNKHSEEQGFCINN